MIRSNNTSQGISFNKSSSLRKYLPVIGIILLVIVSIVIIRNRPTAKANQNNYSVTSTNLEVTEPKKIMDLNRTFEFPILDASGVEVSKMEYLIETAELRDEIIVKGQKASSVSDRTFLVLTIKITNDLDRRVEINTRDYIRLSVNNSHERLAFNIHNDPVEVDAISTKPTRLALPIDDVDNQKLILHVGEITGEKQPVELTF